MELQSYRIIFDTPSGVHFAGETVTGRIEVELGKPKQIAGIYLIVKGEAQVHWIEGQEYNGQEEYLKLKLYCLGDERHARVTLPSGTHIYPFSFELPHTLPSSFEGQFGNVRYTVKAVIERPWKWNHEIKSAFTVISPYDLNTSSNLTSPAKREVEDYPCCCTSYLMSVVLMVPKTGYVCGQKIPVVIEIDNASSIDVPSADLTFQQITLYSAQRPKKQVREEVIILEKRKLGSVMQSNSKSWTHVVSIPALPPSNVSNSSIIRTDYQINIEVLHTSITNKMKLSIPITIGTVPFAGDEHRASVPELPPPDYDTLMAEKPGSSREVGNNNAATFNTPTQMFGEYRFFNAVSIQDTDDNEYTRFNNNLGSFTPHYPIYNANNINS